LLNVGETSRFPLVSQRAPMCGPTLLGALKNRVPVTEPETLGTNFTPSVMPVASPLSSVSGVEKSKIVSSGVTGLEGLGQRPIFPARARYDAGTPNTVQ
jgi:hypothetical protein